MNPAWDDHRQDTVHAKVVRTFTKVAHGLRRIITGQDTILATREHPFYAPSLSKYLPADSIKTGMQLLTFTGALLSVIHQEHLDTTVQVYNFEVEQYHNYFVGEEGVLVHNDCRVNDAGISDANITSAFGFPANTPLFNAKKAEIAEFLGENNSSNAPLYQFFLKQVNGVPPTSDDIIRRLHSIEALKNTSRKGEVSDLEKVEAFLKQPSYPADPGNIPYYERIQNSISGAPSNRLDNIIEGLEYGVIRRYKLPTQAEIDFMHQLRTQDYVFAITQKPTRNSAFVNGEIDGVTIELESISGGGAQGDIWQNFGNFEPVSPPYYPGLTTPPYNNYVNHSEQKIADYLQSQLGINHQADGQIRIVTRKEYCDNCDVIIDQFQLDYPNVEITRIDLGF